MFTFAGGKIALNRQLIIFREAINEKEIIHLFICLLICINQANQTRVIIHGIQTLDFSLTGVFVQLLFYATL